eukprot:8870226-Alexandrium_andersonii.AAC.1
MFRKNPDPPGHFDSCKEVTVLLAQLGVELKNRPSLAAAADHRRIAFRLTPREATCALHG